MKGLLKFETLYKKASWGRRLLKASVGAPFGPRAAFGAAFGHILVGFLNIHGPKGERVNNQKAPPGGPSEGTFRDLEGYT